MKEQHSAELNALVLQQDPTALPGTKGYMRHVQGCLTQMVKGLSEAEVREFAAVAEEWNNTGVDMDRQAK